MQPQDVRTQDPNIRETPTLIASDKVEGTAVYDVNDNHIGSIERIILEKHGGRVAYAVLSFGGFLGIGNERYPLPWEKLTYDERLDGYRIDLTKEQIENAPSLDDDDDSGEWFRDNGRKIYDYYGVPPYWI